MCKFFVVKLKRFCREWNLEWRSYTAQRQYESDLKLSAFVLIFGEPYKLPNKNQKLPRYIHLYIFLRMP